MNRTIDLRLIEPSAYGRKPLWDASDRNWPSIGPVYFRADDKGDGNIERIAARLLDDSELEFSVD